MNRNPSGKRGRTGQEYIRKIFQDSEKNIWFCTWGGLIKINPIKNDYQEFTFDHFQKKATKISNVTFTILQISPSEFLVGTESGVLKIDQNGALLETFQHDPSNPESLSNNTVFNIYRDSKGRIWVGTFSGGLNLLDLNSGKCKVYRMEQGLPNDCIYGILEDKTGNLWISTNNGLSCFQPERNEFINFSKSDGLLSSAFNFGAFAKQSDNNFIFGTEEGIISFNPENLLSEEQKEQPISITGVQVLNTSKDFNYFFRNNQSVTLEPNENIFRIDMVSPTYDHPKRTIYEYKIDPLISDWVNHGNEGSFIFNNLPYGNFNLLFRVKSMNDQVNPIVTIPLFVKPPFVKTVLFKLLMIVSFLSILLLLVFIRIRQIKKVQKIRLQIANDLHDEIGSTLSSIGFSGYQLQKNNLSKAEVQYQGQQILNLSKKTADSIREILWFINPKNDSFPLVLKQMEGLARTLFAGKELKISIPENIPDINNLKLKRNLFLIYKEILANIVKHADAERVEINIQLSNNNFILSIFDSGIGFDTESESEGLGLASMKSRVKEINGSIEIQSTKGKGSSFIVKIPSWKKSFNLF